MTDRRELETLKLRMQQHGAIVRFFIDKEGWIDSVYIVGAKGIKECWRQPIEAAERMRQWLYDRAQEETLEGQLKARLKKEAAC